jgi:hypothetical protein
MTRLAVLLVAAVLLAACGSDDEVERPPAAPGATDLTAVIHPEGPDGPVRRERLRCPGDSRCDRLDAKAFEPTPQDVACTEIYGGPATARVTGRLEGRTIDARFSRNNGCEIARWDALEWLLGRAPGPSAP